MNKTKQNIANYPNIDNPISIDALKFQYLDLHSSKQVFDRIWNECYQLTIDELNKDKTQRDGKLIKQTVDYMRTLCSRFSNEILKHDSGISFRNLQTDTQSALSGNKKQTQNTSNSEFDELVAAKNELDISWNQGISSLEKELNKPIDMISTTTLKQTLDTMRGAGQIFSNKIFKNNSGMSYINPITRGSEYCM